MSLTCPFIIKIFICFPIKSISGTNCYFIYISVKLFSVSDVYKRQAMYAGLCNTTADYVIVMDADLQHPPALVPEMIKQIEAGYDCCAALRTSRKGESKIKSFFSGMF